MLKRCKERHGKMGSHGTGHRHFSRKATRADITERNGKIRSHPVARLSKVMARGRNGVSTGDRLGHRMNDVFKTEREAGETGVGEPDPIKTHVIEIGRASCRERA